jgi:hypothetical protein
VMALSGLTITAICLKPVPCRHLIQISPAILSLFFLLAIFLTTVPLHTILKK